MLDVRIVFDALLEAFPSMTHIAADHVIVSNPKFESGLVSVQRGRLYLSLGEIIDDPEIKELLKKFEVSCTTDISEEQSQESLVLKALKSKRLLNQGIYGDTTSVCPTSNHLERLFSQCKLIRTQLRQSLLPGTLEMILFLKVNRR